MKRKGLAVGIILLFVGISSISTAICTATINQYGKYLNEKECSPLRENITVTFTYPENGIYWNNHKIMPFSVPLILFGNGELVFHGFRFYRDTPVDYTVESSVGITLIEFYVDGVLIGNVTTPPYEFKGLGLMTRFSHKNLKIIAYGANQGDWGSDEITIYRLFL
jgi:hypothetical protein